MTDAGAAVPIPPGMMRRYDPICKRLEDEAAAARQVEESHSFYGAPQAAVDRDRGQRLADYQWTGHYEES